MLEHKLLVDAVVGRVGSSNSHFSGPLSIERVVVLSHGGARARQPLALDLGDLLLLPRDNVLLGVQLVPDVLGVLEGLDVLFVSIGLLRQILVERVIDRGLSLFTRLVALFGNVLCAYCLGGHDSARVIVVVEVFPPSFNKLAV